MVYFTLSLTCLAHLQSWFCLQETSKVQPQLEKQEKQTSEMETQPPPSDQNSCVEPTLKDADNTKEVR